MCQGSKEFLRVGECDEAKRLRTSRPYRTVRSGGEPEKTCLGERHTFASLELFCFVFCFKTKNEEKEKEKEKSPEPLLLNSQIGMLNLSAIHNQISSCPRQLIQFHSDLRSSCQELRHTLLLNGLGSR